MLLTRGVSLAGHSVNDQELGEVPLDRIRRKAREALLQVPVVEVHKHEQIQQPQHKEQG